jgi:hypothetical protein
VLTLWAAPCDVVLPRARYDIEAYQRVEQLIGKKLPPFECEEATVGACLTHPGWGRGEH